MAEPDPGARVVEVRAGDASEAGVALVAVAVPKDSPLSGPAAAADRRLGGPLARALEEGSFRAESDELRLFLARTGEGPHVLAVGTGTDSADAACIRAVAGRAIREARARRLGSVALALPARDRSGPSDDSRAEGTGEDAGAPPALVQAAAEGFVLGDWSYDALLGDEGRRDRGPRPARAVVLLQDGDEVRGAHRRAAERGRIVAEAQNAARELVTLPANLLTPSMLADAAAEIAGGAGLRVEAWGAERLRREGFGALLAVARGSREEPRFIILEHAGGGGRPYVVVGKGVTFDAGGISLKPASGMEAMKYDMAGAAAALSVVRAAAELGLERRVIALVPSAENLPSGSALRPGDVIRGLANRSIEVVNTDAEGRLILSDALAFAARLDPASVVDVATLTGGCIVALGRHAIGLMSPDDPLASALARAGERTGERIWRLPLWQEYRRQLDSEIADLKNTGGREASTITAGWFLREFAGDAPWAHLDVAGTAWAEEESAVQPKGATGVGVRLLTEWLDPTG